MRRFAELHLALEETPRAADREAALVDYFRQAPPADAAWALSFLTGGRQRRLVTPAQLRQWAAEVTGLPLWLVEESQQVVGDLAEAIAHLMAGAAGEPREWALHRLVEERLRLLATTSGQAARRALLLVTWRELPADQHLLWNKLVSGTFRSRVTLGLVARAFATASGCDATAVAQRLAAPWTPSEGALRYLCGGDAVAGEPRGAYPFLLASTLDEAAASGSAAPDAASLGRRDQWLAEWHWSGLRAQLLRRDGEPLLWSRAEELVTTSFPEVAAAAAALPSGTVLDGQLLAWEGERPRSSSLLERRLGRERPSPRLLAEVPVSFLAYDLLESGGADWRRRPLRERRAALRELLAPLAGGRLLLSPALGAEGWEELDALRRAARGHGTQGLMLKRLDSPYVAGRHGEAWWKWRAPPLRVEAVLVYAQRGEGPRSSHYVDYTFALWQDGELVPIAKTGEGLTAGEVEELDRWVRRSIVDRFGPVRQVRPELVFELAFDAVDPSSRHKAGLTLRAPRVASWLRQHRAADAASLDSLRALLG
jgi:DNA ligase 1